jgi:competence transcription factor ComK
MPGSVVNAGFRKSSGTKQGRNRVWFSEHSVAKVKETGKDKCEITLANGQVLPVDTSAMTLFQKLAGTYEPSPISR